jgi:hypothetical protein
MPRKPEIALEALISVLSLRKREARSERSSTPTGAIYEATSIPQIH